MFVKVPYDPASVVAEAGSTYIIEYNDTEIVYHQNLGLSTYFEGERTMEMGVTDWAYLVVLIHLSSPYRR